VEEMVLMYYTVKEKLWFAYANALVTLAHYGQKRKWSNDPYIIHPRAVAKALKETHASPQAIVVALLHDVIEDTWLKYPLLKLLIGKDVAKCVYLLSYLPERFPKEAKNRELKKKWYFEQIINASNWYDEVCIAVKIADMQDNAVTMEINDPIFYDKVALPEYKLFKQMLSEKRLNSIARHHGN
jgi:(p)ppGpp synthase/HD superfamily hydrolase